MAIYSGFSIKNGGSFHSYVNVYQAGYITIDTSPWNHPEIHHFSGWNIHPEIFQDPTRHLLRAEHLRRCRPVVHGHIHPSHQRGTHDADRYSGRRGRSGGTQGVAVGPKSSRWIQWEILRIQLMEVRKRTIYVWPYFLGIFPEI